MTQYIDHGVTLSSGQAKEIKNALDNDCEVTIKISKNNLTGESKLPLTKAQFNKITKSKTNVELTLSKTQLKHMEKTGGFLPILAALIAPAGGLAGGISTAVNLSREASEKARHNRVIEKLTEKDLTKEGGTMHGLSNPKSINGRTMSNTLKKYGLPGNTDDLIGATWDNGLYLEGEGSGLFLGRRTGHSLNF